MTQTTTEIKSLIVRESKDLTIAQKLARRGLLKAFSGVQFGRLTIADGEHTFPIHGQWVQDGVSDRCGRVFPGRHYAGLWCPRQIAPMSTLTLGRERSRIIDCPNHNVPQYSSWSL